MKKLLAGFVILLAAIVLLALLFDWGRKTSEAPGLPAATSTASEASSSALLTIFSPAKGAAVASPIAVSGKAPGNWFFEGVFPVKLVDADENTVGEGQAVAQSDWTASGSIAFTAEISYVRASTTDDAILVFKNDNPSGDPSRDEYFYLPVVLK